MAQSKKENIVNAAAVKKENLVKQPVKKKSVPSQKKKSVPGKSKKIIKPEKPEIVFKEPNFSNIPDLHNYKYEKLDPGVAIGSCEV